MSDVVLVAIVTAASTLIASGITGCAVYLVSKSQTKARTIELEQQLKHQEREARRNRLIETRSKYLIPLREIVSKWVVELNHLIDEIVSLALDIPSASNGIFTYVSKKDKSHRQFLNSLNSVESQMKDLKVGLEVVLGQVTDKKLSNIIREVLFKETSVRLHAWPILSHELNLWMKQETSAESINKAIDDVRVASWQLQDYLQQINKRIEELLVGEEAE